jgi:hypothetical protein
VYHILSSAERKFNRLSDYYIIIVMQLQYFRRKMPAKNENLRIKKPPHSF